MPILITTNPSLTKPQKAAARIRGDIQRAFMQMKNTFNMTVMQIWNNPDPELTPQAIIAEFGTDAAELFGLSNAMIGLMNTFAGAEISTIIPAKYSVTVNEDGSITITENSSSSSSSSSSGE
jgi:hypothetical protein